MKKIIVFLLLFVFVFFSFAQSQDTTTVEELKKQLSQTTEMLKSVTALAEKLEQENKDKDATINQNTELIKQLQQALADKDKALADLQNKLNATIDMDNATIYNLQQQVLKDGDEIKQLRDMLDEVTNKYELYKKTNTITLRGGYTINKNILIGADYSFFFQRFRFSVGAFFITPNDIGAQAGIGYSF